MNTSQRILIVDDQDANLDMLGRRLSRSGYIVETANSGRAAISRIRESAVDLVLLDQMMPIMNGTEVLAEVRETLSPQQLPIIMVTAVSDGKAVVEALDRGANDYVTKPIDFPVVLARIRAQLTGRQVHSDLQRTVAKYESDAVTRMKTDAVTGLANRLAFAEVIHPGSSCGEKHEAAATAVITFNIDRFKLLNASIGKANSDLLLRQMAERTQQTITGFREEEASETNIDGHAVRDVIACLGEAEFGVVLNPAPSEERVQKLAETLVATMRQSFLVAGRPLFCSITLGLVVCDGSTSDAESVIADAHTAQLAAEASSKKRWMRFDPSMRNAREKQLQLDSELRLALQRAEFEVFYQSRVHLETGDICGFEALVRWNHPTRGLVSPAEFIPAIEAAGLVHELGLWVMEEACRQAQTWRADYHLDDTFEVAVNVSAKQCWEPFIIEQVAKILERTGLPASSLKLELTESTFLEDLAGARKILKGLTELGVGLKLDDFGTGYSCLKYLSELPFESLKLDHSFTADLDQQNSDTTEMVRTIILMASNLGLHVVAEGIEDHGSAQLLQGMGCQYGQGYLYSKPVAAAAAGELLRLDAKRKVQTRDHVQQ